MLENYVIVAGLKDLLWEHWWCNLCACLEFEYPFLLINNNQFFSMESILD